jgi:ABC-type multidrug transport system fused ATPase/permease subunit
MILSRRERGKIYLVILLQIFLGILDLIGVAIVGALASLAVSGVGSKQPGDRVSSALALINLDGKSLQYQAVVLGLSAAIILVTKTILSVVFVRKTIYFLSRRSAVISSNLVGKVLSQPLVQLQSRSMQKTLFSVTTGVDTVTIGVLNTFVLMVSDIALLAIMGFGLFVVDPILAFSSLIVFSTIGLFMYLVLQNRAKFLGAEVARISINSSEKILEVLNSYREIVVRNRRSFYAREIGAGRFELANVTAERSFMPNVSKYVIEVTVVCAALIVGAVQFTINDAFHAVTVLSVFLAASTRIAPAVLRLQQSSLNIRSSLGTVGPTLDLIESLNDLKAVNDSDDAIYLNHNGFNARITLDNVSVRYPENDEWAVKDVSLEIQPGKVVAIVGPSGAGKTSIVDTILGIIGPSEGSVMISGESPSNAISRWPGAIGYVPQDVMIINGTIRANVAMGFPENVANDFLVWDALRISHLEDFVRSLPQGLDTEVGDRGARLSGGQRQRLGIARAMFTKPALLVLDEATSSLDGETEANISDSIHELKGGVTIVIIAHRLSTIRESDVVYYMQDGEMIFFGTFDEVRANVSDFDHQAKLMGL